jgi:aminoglycoside phosphotransferase (APT) family kinase protein
MSGPPPATGVRRDWRQLPARVRAAIEQRLGSPVVSAATQAGGFSPGLAARLRTADGRRAFVKAVGPELNPDAPAFHRREALIAASLPVTAPTPRLLWAYDEGEAGWVALAFEDVDGRQPAQPWRADELDRALAALADLAAALTPSPTPIDVAGSVANSGLFDRGWWRRVRDERPAGLDDWSARHVAALAEWEAAAPDAVVGETLLHLDVRADNLLLTPDRVLFVDWPHARVGAAWVDLIGFAPSAAMQGGPHPEELLRRHPAGRAADPAAVTAAVVAVAGFFTWGALQPPPPGLPTLRAFQAAQGAVARAWVARRTGLA